MKRYLEGILFLCMCLCTSILYGQNTSITYTSSTDDIANPERGIYHHTETHSGSYSSLNQNTLINYRTNDKITLILRMFYLEDFTSSNISSTYLTKMQADFNAIRNAGLKCIVRFAYTDQTSGWPPVAPYGDATKAWMLNHITQLEPYLKANSDIIAAVQAGFIGIWGEWYYTTYFGDPNNGNLNATNYADRKEISNRLLDALPSNRMIQMRTPFYKYQLYTSGSLTSLNNSNAYNGSHQARIGHHNDCFLASSTDFGTYLNKSTEYPYMKEDTKYTPMGGETCELNSPRTDCSGDALTEMNQLHWSFLNIDYINTVWNSWTSQGCSLDIKKSLGYRYQLNNGSFSTSAKQGGSLQIKLNISNIGWAAPFNPRNAEIVLKNISDNKIAKIKLPEDPRKWQAGTTFTLDYTIGIPSNFPNGQYKVYLSLPDPEPSLYENSSYSIRLANSNVPWDNTKGYNDLNYTLNLSDSYSSSNYSGSLWLDNPYGTLSVELLDFQANVVTNNVEITWTSSHELNFQKYIVEKSTDGLNFVAINTTLPSNSSNTIKSYQYNDPIGSAGIFYYRLKMVDNNGNINYSTIKHVTVSEIPLNIIYPQEEGNTFKLKLNSIANGNITFELFDLSGKLIYQQNTYYSGQEINISKEFNHGLYILRLVLPDGLEYNSKIIIRE